MVSILLLWIMARVPHFLQLAVFELGFFFYLVTYLSIDYKKKLSTLVNSHLHHDQLMPPGAQSLRQERPKKTHQDLLSGGFEAVEGLRALGF